MKKNTIIGISAGITMIVSSVLVILKFKTKKSKVILKKNKK